MLNSVVCCDVGLSHIHIILHTHTHLISWNNGKITLNRIISLKTLLTPKQETKAALISLTFLMIHYCSVCVRVHVCVLTFPQC